MSSPRPTDRLKLSLSEDPLDPRGAASWVAPLVQLGSRSLQYAETLAGRQLIIAISVPRRDYAAALIGCGWVMATEVPDQPDTASALRSIAPHTPVRIVTSFAVVVDYFIRFDESKTPPRLQLSQSQWQLSSVRAVMVLDNLEAPIRMPRPSPGALFRLADTEHNWDARLASATADLAIVGTLTWLRDDMKVFVRNENRCPRPTTGAADSSARRAALGGELAPSDGFTSLGDVLMPTGRDAATGFTRLHTSARFVDQLPFPGHVRSVVLDGSGPIRFVAQIETPVVFCILDRSVANETAADILVQLRNSRGEPVSVVDELRWDPPAGIEIMAFTVPL